MTDTALVWLIGAVLVLVATVPFVVARRRRERRARTSAHVAERAGLHEPASLHPVVDPARCLGCGACTAACPEGDVLGLVGGQATAIAPARCVGHGMCQRSCPTDAISLVFGTAARGVDLPRVRGDFQTNVDGLYIAGELGGMGLIRNAVEQGRQAAEGIARRAAREAPPPGFDGLDAVVVGAGPAGFAAAAALDDAGLDYAVLERAADVGGAVRQYPRRKLVMTQPFTLPGWGRIDAGTLPKETLTAAWGDALDASGVAARLRTGWTVEAVTRQDGAFTVASAEGDRLRARYVVLAIGRRGVPRRLDVPGEDAAHVVYALLEPEAFAGRRCLVVGGGDSAVEAAVALADAGAASVRLSYRRAAVTRAKAGNLRALAEAVEAGTVEPLWETTVTAIGPDHADLEGPDGAVRIDADDVVVLIGGELPTAFLERSGVALDTHFGVPRIGAEG